jgi:hypothetical protein
MVFVLKIWVISKFNKDCDGTQLVKLLFISLVVTLMLLSRGPLGVGATASPIYRNEIMLNDSIYLQFFLPCWIVSLKHSHSCPCLFYVINLLCAIKWQLKKQTGDELKKAVDIPKVYYFMAFSSVHQLALTNVPSSPSKKSISNTYSLQCA